MNIKIFCRCRLFPSWSGQGLTSISCITKVPGSVLGQSCRFGGGQSTLGQDFLRILPMYLSVSFHQCPILTLIHLPLMLYNRSTVSLNRTYLSLSRSLSLSITSSGTHTLWMLSKKILCWERIFLDH